MSKGGGNMRNDKKNIKVCIQEKGFKLKSIAKKVGVTPQHFSKKLKTPWKFTIEELIKIANSIGEDYTNFEIGIDI